MQPSAPPAPALRRDALALHRVLEDLLRAVQFRDRDRICCHGISVSQCYALEAICRRGPLRLNELAGELLLDKSTTSRVVDGVLAKDLATRRPDPADGRAVLIEATAAGRELHDRIQEELVSEVELVIADFEPETRRALVGLMGRLSRVAVARVEVDGGCCQMRVAG